MSLLAGGGVPTYAAPLRYLLDVPDGRDAAFEVAFQVEYPGEMVVQADWAGARILSFRLEGPAGASVRDRRSGPSPQRMEIAVDPRTLALGRDWKLSILALSGHGDAKGMITVQVPDAPEVVAEREKQEAPPPPPPPVPDPWTLPARPPEGARADVVRVYDAVERFRARVVLPDGEVLPDSCRWQSDLLRQLAAWRDAVAANQAPPPDPTLRYLQHIVEAVRHVEELRTSTDPILAGPAPEESLRRRAWLQIRKERVRPLERELDVLSDSLRRGFAPQLESETWPFRVIACLTACERYFDETLRLGPEGAANPDLARAQWDPIVSAAGALEAMAAFLPAPASSSASPPVERAPRP